MTASDRRFALGCLLAVVVPAAALHFGAPEERLKAGLTAAPFGWPRVLVAHLVTALPLGLVIARCLRAVSAVNDLVRGAWVLIGGALAGAAVLVCPGVAEVIWDGGFDFAPLLLLRALIALALVLPWCIWALDAPEPGVSNAAPLGRALALASAFALLPCGLYSEAVVAARTESAADLVSRERVARADAVLAGLVELGSDREVAKRSPAALRKEYAQVLPRLAESAGRPLSAGAPPRARLSRALELIQLDRSAEAAALLEPLAAPENDTMSMLLATVYRDLERWAESDALFARVLEKNLPRAGTDPGAAETCVRAIEGLAFNARADGRPQDTERALTRGLDELPGRAAEFHFQLGRHYHDGGRPGLALEHLREAVRLDPKYAEPADRITRAIRTATPACFSWR